MDYYIVYNSDGRIVQKFAFRSSLSEYMKTAYDMGNKVTYRRFKL